MKKSQVITLGMIAIFILYLQIFKIRFGTDLIILVLFGFALFQKKPLRFIREWSFPIVLFFLYEFIRGRANLIADFFGFPIHVEILVAVERKFFFFLSDIPDVVIQHALKPTLGVTYWYDYVLFFFYTSFFWFWLLSGFIIWIKKHEYFHRFIYGLVGMALFSTLIFIIAPTAPPWYASDHGYLPEIHRVLWAEGGALKSNQLQFVSTYGGNPVAAFPSNHVAWPVFTSIWLIALFGIKKAGWTLSLPILIAFATWYGAEHYVIDSLFATLMAGFFFSISWNWNIWKVPQKIRSIFTFRLR